MTKYQAPRGTRDFYPAEMAQRRHLESVWRSISVIHGFEEVEGPTYEHLELYTAKSGPGIVSELFSFRRADGDTDYALRPEFTPTLARMVAARAAQLPKPIRWFSMSSMFRAERPQRGRLREHLQWNADVVGDDSAQADADVIAIAVGIFRALGLAPEDIQIKLSHRRGLETVLRGHGVPNDRMLDAFALVDAAEKIGPPQFRTRAAALGVDGSKLDDLMTFLAEEAPAATDGIPGALQGIAEFDALHGALTQAGLLEWCTYRPSLARGLAYYTGTVFEAHETSGAERAVAGGGRYDNLVELCGGPPTPAVGVAMGDVVIGLLLRDRGKLGDPAEYLPRPDVFIVNALDDAHAARNELAARLRRAGLHTRYSGRVTRNVGKLLGDAGKARAHLAVILGEEYSRGVVVVKDLEAGTQDEVALASLENDLLRRRSRIPSR